MSTLDILEDAPLACDIANATIDLIPLSAPGSLTSVEKRSLLSGFVRLSFNAAAIASNVGQAPILAIEMLETGRAVLASFLQDMRTDTTLTTTMMVEKMLLIRRQILEPVSPEKKMVAIPCLKWKALRDVINCDL